MRTAAVSIPQIQNVAITLGAVVAGVHTVETQALSSTLTMVMVTRPIHGVQTAVNSRCIMVEELLRFRQVHLISQVLRMI